MADNNSINIGSGNRFENSFNRVTGSQPSGAPVLPTHGVSKQMFREVVQFVAPFMDDAATRRSIVMNALFGSSVLASIDYTGSGEDFTVRLVAQLINHGQMETGENALAELLDEIGNRSGTDKAQQAQALKAKLAAG